MPRLNIAAFPNCCGITVVYGFPFRWKDPVNCPYAEGTHNYDWWQQNEWTPEDFEAQLREHVKAARGYLMASLNNEQRPLLDKMMKDAGFRVIAAEVPNRLHHDETQITLYMYRRPAKKVKPKAKPESSVAF